MADVFISYAREDRDTAQSIAKALETAEYSVWWDRDLLGGQPFDEIIEREVELAGSVIVLWSRHSVTSNWVKSEAAVAAERGVLVPVFIEKVKLPLEFRRKHTIDLTAWNGDPSVPKFDPIRLAIAAHLGLAPATFKSGRGSKASPAVKYALGVAVLAALVIIAMFSRNTFLIVKPPDPETAADPLPNLGSSSKTAKSESDSVVDIKGPWNQATGQKIASLALGEKDWTEVERFCSETSCIPVHTLLGEYHLLYKARESLILAFASIEEASGGCHVCAPHLSFFEFEKMSNGWKLIQSDIAVLQYGSWGGVEPSSVNVYPIGDNIYGIVLESADGGQGRNYTATSIYARLGDSLQPVLEIQTGEDDTGALPEGAAVTSWSSEIKIQPGSTGFYDLLVRRSGEREGAPFEESEIFKFNGRKYVQAQLYQ